MKTICFILILIFTAQLHGQKYEPNWESLDKRPVPEWFGDAKFGIFIHWGPYSVPAWSPKGTYSEWYQYWLQSKALFGNGDFKGDEVYQHHRKTYGEHFDYYEFADQFTADLYDPEAWATLFEAAGAKYVVLTSKHHDGFTLWPNEQANDRGFAWNSMETGAKRDLAGELSAAVKKTPLKMGFYYSLYEWYHPWWQNDKQRFVDEHFLPQVKDLVQKYQPDILWGDGEWEMEAEKWKTPELLAWLYNESAAKDNIVVNDRWGKGIRQHHGGYFTTEYEAGKEFDKPWEECRGMGFSFGYNQNEDAQDYNSPRALLLMLIDIVSNGGNLLLDIGPDGRGKIPPIMQERLLAMGAWLRVNGEAIYGTEKWAQAAQWSAGDRTIDHKGGYLGGDYILKQTIDPAPGKAVKELFFTSKGADLYAIAPVYPKGKLSIKGVKPTAKTKVTLLGYPGNLKYSYKNGALTIDVPMLTYDELPCQYAWSFKITDKVDMAIAPEEMVRGTGLSDAEKKEGFKMLFNGKDLDGWVGNKTAYQAVDGQIVIDPNGKGGGNLFTEEEYSDFIFRFEFQLTPGANNGLGIHALLEGDAAYVGKELQILDNTAEIYANLQDYQYHGSVYGIIPAKRGFLKPVGAWNQEEVIVKGSKIKVILNGTTIVDGDFLEASKNGTMDGKDHPGLQRTKGHIGFLGHGSVVKFRNIRIKDLSK